jgi:hypothetical protein
MDFSNATDAELRAELDGAQRFLDALMNGVPLGQPFDGREEKTKTELRLKIMAIQSELDKRDKG